MKYIIKRHDGFTLIETMVAMVIFTIGILALFGMQSAAIKENIVANNVTTGAALASARVEELIAMSYDDSRLEDPDKIKDCTFFSPEWCKKNEVEPEAYGEEVSGQAKYSVYWAVAQDCTLTRDEILDVGLEDDSPYRPKHLFIAVTRDNGNGDEDVTAEFSYIKQNTDY
ncbi:MAG: prepilin-type N-terminal cleavage/methylation domain-containing protein [Candidatus Electrothrix sp. ATG2]|nr:prepilin-type N-terminal cleavage/methylation domain-containing protein [Candidatus Electrothrix sp. ATG2]